MKIRRSSQRDIDRLLSGAVPEDESLARLVPLAQLLRSVGGHTPPDAEVHRVAAEAARLALAASEKAPTTSNRQAGASKARRTSLVPRLATALVAILVVSSATLGVAYAANGAAPGDNLYGLDLALEHIGIGAGGLHERLNEANDLAQAGDVETGLSHALEALAQEGLTNESARQAGRALNGAAGQAATLDQRESASIRALVTQTLHWMATTDASGNDFALGVTDLARGIAQAAASGTSGATTGGNSQTTTTDTTGTAHTQSDGAGPGGPGTTNGPPDTGGRP